MLARDIGSLDERRTDRLVGDHQRELTHDHSNGQTPEVRRGDKPGEHNRRGDRGNLRDPLRYGEPAHTEKRRLAQLLVGHASSRRRGRCVRVVAFLPGIGGCGATRHPDPTVTTRWPALRRLPRQMPAPGAAQPRR